MHSLQFLRCFHRTQTRSVRWWWWNTCHPLDSSSPSSRSPSRNHPRPRMSPPNPRVQIANLPQTPLQKKLFSRPTAGTIDGRPQDELSVLQSASSLRGNAKNGAFVLLLLLVNFDGKIVNEVNWILCHILAVAWCPAAHSCGGAANQQGGSSRCAVRTVTKRPSTFTRISSTRFC